jgi:hypothetical protein
MNLLDFEDLLLAKVFSEEAILDLDLLQKMVIYLDRQGGSLVALMVQQNCISETDPRIAASRTKMQRYLFMMREAIFGEMLFKSKALTPDLLVKLKTFQKREGYSRSMKLILEQSGYLDMNMLNSVAEKTLARMSKHRNGILLKYRQEQFKGVKRPLTKQSKSASAVSISRAPSDPKINLPSLPLQKTTGSPDLSVQNPEQSIRTGTEPDISHMEGPASEVVEGEQMAQSGDYISRETLAMTVPDIEDLRGQSTDPYVGVVIGDHFRLIKRLGQGAMGVVYLAQARDSDELVAVKLVLEIKKNPEAINRFKREILATSFFDHPNVVQIYEAGETSDGAYFMVLEYVRGEEIRDVLKRQKRFTPIESVGLLVQLLEGLSAAHKANIIHKDIKPENLMLTARDGQPYLKIMDFGLARILDIEEDFGDQIYKTMEGQISGSPAYIAPETISGDEVTQPADIYSVGITFFELLSGALPYGARSLREHIMSHLYKPAKPLSEIYPAGQFPPEIQEFIDKCLQKNPAHRFQSCDEALEFVKTRIDPALLREAPSAQS